MLKSRLYSYCSLILQEECYAALEMDQFDDDDDQQDNSSMSEVICFVFKYNT